MNLAEQEKEALREAEALDIRVMKIGWTFRIEPANRNFSLAELQIYLDGYRDGSRAHGAAH